MRKQTEVDITGKSRSLSPSNLNFKSNTKAFSKAMQVLGEQQSETEETYGEIAISRKLSDELKGEEDSCKEDDYLLNKKIQTSELLTNFSRMGGGHRLETAEPNTEESGFKAK